MRLKSNAPERENDDSTDALIKANEEMEFLLRQNLPILKFKYLAAS